MLNKQLIEYKIDEKEKTFIKVKYDKKFIIIETPFLRVPFGIKEYDLFYKKIYNYQVSVNTSYNEKSGNFLRFILFIEKDAKDKFSKSDFLKNKNFVSRIYKPEKNDPLIKLDIKENTIIKDENNNVITLKDYIEKRFICLSIIKYTGIYIGENNWGLSLKVEEIKIKNQKVESHFISFN